MYKRILHSRSDDPVPTCLAENVLLSLVHVTAVFKKSHPQSGAYLCYDSYFLSCNVELVTLKWILAVSPSYAMKKTKP